MSKQPPGPSGPAQPHCRRRHASPRPRATRACPPSPRRCARAAICRRPPRASGAGGRPLWPGHGRGGAQPAGGLWSRADRPDRRRNRGRAQPDRLRSGADAGRQSRAPALAAARGAAADADRRQQRRRHAHLLARRRHRRPAPRRGRPARQRDAAAALAHVPPRRQSDLDGSGIDRGGGDPAQGRGLSPAQQHGPPRRPYRPAVGTGEFARPGQVRHAERPVHLSARHAGQGPVQPGRGGISAMAACGSRTRSDLPA